MQGRSASDPSHRADARITSDAAWAAAMCRERQPSHEITDEEALFLSFLTAVNSPAFQSRQLGPRAYLVAAAPSIDMAGVHGQEALQGEFNELKSRVESPKHDYAIDLLNDMSLTPAKLPAPERKRRKVAASQSPPLCASPAPTVAAAPAPIVAGAAPASVRKALGGGTAARTGVGKKLGRLVCSSTSSAPASVSSTILLSTCKFVSKRTCVECPDAPRVATHKRGYLACACAQGHQWVWCAKCCACPRPTTTSAGTEFKGCDNGAHWFERDAFDTGRRNHMNRHAGQ